jgi:hypothetical protein
MYAIDRGGLHNNAAHRVVLSSGSKRLRASEGKQVLQVTRSADRSHA